MINTGIYIPTTEETSWSPHMRRLHGAPIGGDFMELA